MGSRVTIHIETSISDGPGGDSALLVDDGEVRLLNMNDCRIHDLATLTADGPIDIQWLQYSGAIWYPMVYDHPPEVMRELVDQKVEAQLSRAQRYVEAVDARVVVPSAGPPCFLDPELFGFNVIDGDELSIFPDQSVFIERLRRAGRTVGPAGHPRHDVRDHARCHHRHPSACRRRDRRASSTTSGTTSERYAADWAPWLERAEGGLAGPGRRPASAG